MSALIWHPDALADIARLYDFLATTNPDAARRCARTLIEAADRINRQPDIGWRRAEFREWPARFGQSAYVIRYVILAEGEVLIVRIWHGRETIPTVIKNDRWFESWFGAPPPANPARDTNGLDRRKSHRSRPLV